MSEQFEIGIIGGTGLYQMEGFTDVREVAVETPFGSPSDRLMVGSLEGRRVAFLPRHGRGHRILPHELNFRANVFALKTLGVEWILSVSAVGSLKERYAPLHVLVPDQFIDRTMQRPSTFFGRGLVAHVAFAQPFCGNLSKVMADACAEAGATHHVGGTYVCMEGPAFSTLAESELYRSWGADVIGMTNLQEAKLAREAEICYATIAMVTDYDCWHEEHDAVDVASVVKVMHDNADRAAALVGRVLGEFPEEHEPCPNGSDRALEHALITHAEARDPELVKKLDAVAGRVLGAV